MVKLVVLVFCGFLAVAFGANIPEIEIEGDAESGVKQPSESVDNFDAKSGIYRPGSIKQKIKDKLE
jgi:hypothetical protein